MSNLHIPRYVPFFFADCCEHLRDRVTGHTRGRLAAARRWLYLVLYLREVLLLVCSVLQICATAGLTGISASRDRRWRNGTELHRAGIDGILADMIKAGGDLVQPAVAVQLDACQALP